MRQCGEVAKAVEICFALVRFLFGLGSAVVMGEGRCDVCCVFWFCFCSVLVFSQSRVGIFDAQPAQKVYTAQAKQWKAKAKAGSQQKSNVYCESRQFGLCTKLASRVLQGRGISDWHGMQRLSVCLWKGCDLQLFGSDGNDVDGMWLIVCVARLCSLYQPKGTYGTAGAHSKAGRYGTTDNMKRRDRKLVARPGLN
ncbi:hypothetical protein B0T22DRAFT_266633 [Podospora appendiculata]|uniref:Uncharacterized protein n=1 Tax=Podospora appendiculata TaxID=314037 RepID=A0AAE0X3P1_9PEZI|nr:hypothetical protein B0T22DRAFT_266633 [Podospora appendiculata]